MTPRRPLKRFVDPARPITYGIVQAGEDVEGGVPYIRPVDMSGHNGVDVARLRTTAPEIAAAYKRSAIRGGDIVVSIGPSFGKTMLVPDELTGANLTQGTARVAVQPRVSGRFVRWALQSGEAQAYWETGVAGATFRALNLGPLSLTPIPVVSEQEQRAIADFLDRETAKIDALIEKQNELIGLLRERRSAVIDRTLEGFPRARMKWSVMLSQTGPFGTQLSAHEYTTGGVPLINPTHITASQVVADPAVSVTPEKARELRRHRLLPGDIVLGRKGEVDKAALVGPELGPALCGSDSMLIRTDVDECRPEYLWWFFQSASCHRQLESMSVGATVTGLNQSAIARLLMPRAPLDQQTRVAAKLKRVTTKIDALIAKTEDFISLTRERRAALITAAVSGQIDVLGEAG